MHTMARIFLAVAVVMIVARPASSVARDAATTSPIKHFIVLMQENHSFDNYFGTYPGADGIPEGTCMPIDPTDPGSDCVEPFHLGNEAITDLGHTEIVARDQLRGGQMDGFIWAHRNNPGGGQHAMGYYDDRDIPYYWNLADNYVLFDRFFTSASGGSVWNHMYWVTGAPGDPSADKIPVGGFGDIPTIFDRLEEAGISWKFYIQNYDPTITHRTREGLGHRGSQVVWVPLLAYDRYIDDPELFSHIVHLDEYYEDLQNDTLPAVAYIVPSGASEHPPGSIQAGERFVRTLINSLMRSRAWDSSAFMWTYDDWGGWYDHVVPPKVDEFGYGFRVPTLLVSPYARRGHVDSTVLDFTSILKFIEENWSLEPLAERDAAADNFLSAFDFSTPRPAVFLNRERIRPEPRPDPNRLVLYAAYAVAIATAAGLTLWAAGGVQSRGVLARRARSLRRLPHR